jgi:uncharacterized protein (TIGR02246 family)
MAGRQKLLEELMRFMVALMLYSFVAATPSAELQVKEQRLDAFFSALADAAQEGDKAGYTKLFSPDAAMYLPNRQPLIGRDQIGDWFEKFRDTVVLVLESYEQEQVKIVGDVAMVRSRGIGHYLVKETGEKLPFDQKYLDILQYEAGNWTMAFHVASSSTFQPGLWNRDWER